MTTVTQDVRLILKEHGYSMTRQRQLIFDLLVHREPMAMYELYERARGSIDRATTYRIIALFEKLGIVRRIAIGWKYKIELSDRFAAHHHHLTCLQCHKVVPINESALETFIHALAASHGFVTVEHQVELQGYCEHCARHL